MLANPSCRAVRRSRNHVVRRPVRPLPGGSSAAFAVERFRAQAAWAQRIVDDGYGFGEDGLSHAVLQEGRAAGHRRAVDRGGEMPDEAARHARVVDHRHLGRWDALRSQSPHGALGGRAPDRFGIRQVGGENGAPHIVVAFHRRAFARDDRYRYPEARQHVRAGKAVAGRQRHRGPAPVGLCALGIGDARMGAGGVFGAGGPFGQLLGRRLGRIVGVEAGNVFGDLVRFGQAAIGVFRYGAGHGDGTLDQFGQRRRRTVRSGHHGLTAADENPQAQVRAFGAFQMFQRAKAARHRYGGRIEQHRIRRVRSGRDGAVDHFGEKVGGGAFRHAVTPVRPLRGRV